MRAPETEDTDHQAPKEVTANNKHRAATEPSNLAEAQVTDKLALAVTVVLHRADLRAVTVVLHRADLRGVTEANNRAEAQATDSNKQAPVVTEVPPPPHQADLREDTEANPNRKAVTEHQPHRATANSKHLAVTVPQPLLRPHSHQADMEWEAETQATASNRPRAAQWAATEHQHQHHQAEATANSNHPWVVTEEPQLHLAADMDANNNRKEVTAEAKVEAREVTDKCARPEATEAAPNLLVTEAPPKAQALATAREAAVAPRRPSRVATKLINQLFNYC